MKGQEKIIEMLNDLLADELAAVNQYIVQSEMCENWGYSKLHGALKKQAVEEMKHVEKLIARILFLEGTPDIGKLNKINIGKNLEEQFKNDSHSEAHAIKVYAESVSLSAKSNDIGTADLLRSILIEEEKHLDWLETQVEQIKQIGIQKYLTEQIS